MSISIPGQFIRRQITINALHALMIHECDEWQRTEKIRRRWAIDELEQIAFEALHKRRKGGRHA